MFDSFLGFVLESMYRKNVFNSKFGKMKINSAIFFRLIYPSLPIFLVSAFCDDQHCLFFYKKCSFCIVSELCFNIYVLKFVSFL